NQALPGEQSPKTVTPSSFDQRMKEANIVTSAPTEPLKNIINDRTYLCNLITVMALYVRFLLEPTHLLRGNNSEFFCGFILRGGLGCEILRHVACIVPWLSLAGCGWKTHIQFQEKEGQSLWLHPNRQPSLGQSKIRSTPATKVLRKDQRRVSCPSSVDRNIYQGLLSFHVTLTFRPRFSLQASRSFPRLSEFDCIHSRPVI
ncbi:hypothetical protein QBC42DRAFT_268576, partial [Cladorrhinum samala]